jgi:hypothetical protein
MAEQRRPNVSPRVHNKRAGTAPEGSVYIGRPSKWGNPFTHQEGTLAAFKVTTRAEAIGRFRWWITEGDGSHLLNDLHELRGRDLVCWCHPAACHGDVLVELANV